MRYFDTTYLVRLYTFEPGWKTVREFAEKDQIACSILGKAEMIGAFHRKFREGEITQRDLSTLIDEFEEDSRSGSVAWIPLAEGIVERVSRVYKTIPASNALRSSDAIHLASAAESNFSEIYTNDRRLLAAAHQFGLKGLDLIQVS